MFDLKNVSFQSEGKNPKTLLGDISVSFPTGEFSAIVGHNGSGKSTLLKLLARKNKPASGQITLDTQILDTHSTRDFARKVAYLPQSPIVPATLVCANWSPLAAIRGAVLLAATGRTIMKRSNAPWK